MQLLLRRAHLRSEAGKEKRLELSVIIDEDTGLSWSVATDVSTTSPIRTFGRFDDTLDEFKRQLGELCLGGYILFKHEWWGDIWGSYDNEPALLCCPAASGGRVVPSGKSEGPPLAVTVQTPRKESKPSKQTLKMGKA